MFKTFMKRLDGKKSYIVAIATATFAILGVLLGQLEVKEGIELLLGSGALASLRNALE